MAVGVVVGVGHVEHEAGFDIAPDEVCINAVPPRQSDPGAVRRVPAVGFCQLSRQALAPGFRLFLMEAWIASRGALTQPDGCSRTSSSLLMRPL